MCPCGSSVRDPVTGRQHGGSAALGPFCPVVRRPSCTRQPWCACPSGEGSAGPSCVGHAAPGWPCRMGCPLPIEGPAGDTGRPSGLLPHLWALSAVGVTSGLGVVHNSRGDEERVGRSRLTCVDTEVRGPCQKCHFLLYRVGPGGSGRVGGLSQGLQVRSAVTVTCPRPVTTAQS